MTITEFDNTGWTPGMFAMYKGDRCPIVSCDFEEKLVAISGVVAYSDEPTWVRCENIDLESNHG